MVERRHIYCPKCQWVPGSNSQWSCLPVCGTSWNTFDTGGVCPACGELFESTQCPSCHQFSPHKSWYHDDSPDKAAMRETEIFER